VVFSSLVLLSSCLSRSARAAPSLLPRAGGGALTTSGRAAHATRDATRAARGESCGALSEFAARVCVPGVLCFAALFSPLRARRSLAPLLASTEAPGPRAGVRRTRHATRDARAARRVRGQSAFLCRSSRSARRVCFWASLCCPVRRFACLLASFRAQAGGGSRSARVRCVCNPRIRPLYVPGGLCLRWRRVGAGKRVELGEKRVELSQNAWSWAETRGVEPKRVELSETNSSWHFYARVGEINVELASGPWRWPNTRGVDCGSMEVAEKVWC
jgi:hypothetical protein